MTVSERSSDLADGDFVELSYTARTVDDDRIIDTTDPGVATEAALDDVTATGPCTVVLGDGHLFEPVETAIKSAGVGASDRIRVDPGAAFGDVDPTATAVVEVEHLDPDQRTPGSHVVHDGDVAFVESVDDETATLNFNHPLAGTTIEYEFAVRRRVTAFDERVEGLIALYGLDGTLTATRESTMGTDVLELEVTNPESLERWTDRKRRLVSDLGDHLPVEEVRVVERYDEG